MTDKNANPVPAIAFPKPKGKFAVLDEAFFVEYAPHLKANAVAVYARLLQLAAGRKQITVSMEEISCGGMVSIRTARECVNRLVRSGAIDIKEQGADGKPNTYTFPSLDRPIRGLLVQTTRQNLPGGAAGFAGGAGKICRGGRQDLPTDKANPAVSSNREEQDQDKNKEQGAAFDLSPERLAQEWCFYLSANRRWSRDHAYAKRDRPEDLVPEITELIRLGCAAEAVHAEILNPERDHSEHFWEFKKRLRDRRLGRGGGSVGSDSRLRAPAGKYDNLAKIIHVETDAPEREAKTQAPAQDRAGPGADP